MVRRSPVVAAIPNFNMAGQLHRLLGQVLSHDYDAVFVLDDASTDHSAEVAGGFGAAVTFVRSPRNQGAGANRNQILDHVADGALIHFIDADMDLQTPQAPAVVREVFDRYRPHAVGAVGGLVTRADGTQEPHNYGAVFSAWGNLTSALPLALDRLSHRPKLGAALARLVGPALTQWPNVLAPPVPAAPYWLHEGNMVIAADALRAVAGYDPRLRSHEAQDLAIRLDRRGIGRRFDPALEVLHHHIDVRGRNRNKWEYQAAVYLMRKHGLYRWLTAR